MQPHTHESVPSGFVILRAHERRVRHMHGNELSYELLSPDGYEEFALYRARADAGASTGDADLEHEGDENLVVVKGRFEIEIEGYKDVLGPGDSVFIPRGARHRLTNVGDGPGECVFVLCPPRY